MFFGLHNDSLTVCTQTGAIETATHCPLHRLKCLARLMRSSMHYGGHLDIRDHQFLKKDCRAVPQLRLREGAAVICLQNTYLSDGSCISNGAQGTVIGFLGLVCTSIWSCSCSWGRMVGFEGLLCSHAHSWTHYRDSVWFYCRLFHLA